MVPSALSSPLGFSQDGPLWSQIFLDLEGGRWQLQEGALTPFVEAFKLFAARKQWTIAAAHRDGKGLEGPPPLYALR